MTNKCPQCGFPEHESGECPYAKVGDQAPVMCIFCPAVFTRKSIPATEISFEEWCEQHKTGECVTTYDQTKNDTYRSIVMDERYHHWTAEPSLSLLVVDFGDTVVMQLQKGHLTEDQVRQLVNNPDYQEGDITVSELLQFGDDSFADVRKSIDAYFAEDKPVPRIERSSAGAYWEYQLFLDSHRSVGINNDGFQGLSRLFGQKVMDNLPIYEPKGKWTQLASEPVAIWRYER